MGSAQLAVDKTQQTGFVNKTFRPVNDEYQPFETIEKHQLFEERWAVPMLVRMMGLQSASRILEVGCGAGSALIPLARLCKPSRLVGIDIDIHLLEQARPKLLANGFSAELEQEDVRSLPFKNGSFDIVVDLGTCYHINRRVMALKEITRILAPGGILVSETPLYQRLKHPLRSHARRIPWQHAPLLKIRRLSPFWTARTLAA